MMTHLPTFEEMRREAYALLGDVQGVLRSDWRTGTGPSLEQAQAVDRARSHIAAAKTALNEAVTR